MSPGERFSAERTRQLRRLTVITAGAMADVRSALELVRAEIRRLLNAQPSEWRLQQLGLLRREIDDALGRLEGRIGAIWTEGSAATWSAGIALVERPLISAGVTLRFQAVSDGQLLGMRSFLTNRIADITQQAQMRIEQQLRLVIGGVSAPAEAVSGIDRVLGGRTRSRAITITRTELGRAYSVATQLRLAQAARTVSGLKKQWRRSGKIHSRLTHDAADGQIREVDQPFDVGGEQLMYPRDPTASARNTINCGCTQLPYKDDWEVTVPGRRPFSPDELSANPARADLRQ